MKPITKECNHRDPNTGHMIEGVTCPNCKPVGYIHIVKEAFTEAQERLSEPVQGESWEEHFDILWGIAPEGTLKHNKGKTIKQFIRSLLSRPYPSQPQEMDRRI